jgi:hypothetical protein
LNAKCAEYEGEYESMLRTFDEFQTGIDRIMDVIAPQEKANEAKGESESDKSYLLSQLGSIESKANDLIMSNFVLTLPRRSAEEKETITVAPFVFGGITMQGSLQPIVTTPIVAPSRVRR